MNDYINFSKRTTIDILNDKFVDDKDNVNIEKNVNKVKSNKSEYSARLVQTFWPFTR